MDTSIAPKSEARLTLEGSILDGLSRNAHRTHLRVEQTERAVQDILEALFAPPVAWAVRARLDETQP